MLNRLPHSFPPLSMMLHDIGNPKPQELAKAFTVSVRTVQRWLKAEWAPLPIMMAIYWITQWGQSSVNADAHNAAVMHANMARALRDEIATLKATLMRLGRIADFGAANDPALHVPTPPPAATDHPTEKPPAEAGSTAQTTEQPRGLAPDSRIQL